MKKHLVVAATVLSLFSAGLGSTAAMADPRHDNNSRYDNDRRDNGRYDNDRRDHRHVSRWKRGQRVDARFRDRRYEVRDYRSHRLSAPPRGYRWVRDDNNDYLLVAVASGVIASIILGAGR